jgi:beta-xylosidase
LTDYEVPAGGVRLAEETHRRLEDAVVWLKRLGVKHVRTGLSWSDAERPHCEECFDRMVAMLEPFDVTLTFCFTPESKGIQPHHTSAPRQLEEYADFCSRMVRRYTH